MRPVVRDVKIGEWTVSAGEVIVVFVQAMLTDPDIVEEPNAFRPDYSTSASTVQTLSFNTPIGMPPSDQCGRAVYSNFHIAGGQSGGGTTFPAECDSAPLTRLKRR